MRYLDVVLGHAKLLAWEGLTDEQRESYLKATGTKQPADVIKRWAVQTGPEVVVKRRVGSRTGK